MKRLLDIVASSVGLVLLSPVFFIVSLWIKLDSNGPVFFRQVRVTKDEQKFRIFKFRSMTVAQEGGPLVTSRGDARITKSGKIIRSLKIDELPQLINVLKGEMSLVGPRPEVPKYIEFYPRDLREVVFSVPAGITDPASLSYIDEEEILANAEDSEKAYVERVLPEKLRISADYIMKRSFIGDIKIISATVLKMVR